jgi:hypothetical protein
MADVAIDATAGGASANSYVTLAEAQTYHDSQLPANADTWDSAGSGEQSRALVTATRLLDTWFAWRGSISALTQSLLWPRRGVLRPGTSEGQPLAIGNEWSEPFGGLLPSDEVPAIIKNATSELARQLLVSDRTADSDIQTQGITSLTAGPVSLTFSNAVAKPIPDAVMVLGSQLGIPRQKTGTGALHMYRG